ncbi:RNA-binding protein 45 [Cylas formicarius]|uniref:RNA-binding protein 45 n=1 Tax=Cylas formicarius TaxID=197179 RepID=UPI002958DE70|nr:RNA-binding protein 45 [Cylas formicarius]
MTDRRSSTGSHADDPPLSRLFILGPKTLAEEDYRRAFNSFGTIEEIWIVKDKVTRENKGVTYVKFSKTSDAARALETLNGTSLVPGTRKVKIFIASSRDKGSSRDNNEEEKQLRLFVMVPRMMTDDQLYDYFKQFGDVEYATVILDRNTRESKGIAYVKFHKFSDAARAYEQCDRKYKPVFAEPKKPEHIRRGGNADHMSVAAAGRGGVPAPLNLPFPPNLPLGGGGFVKLTVIANPMVTEDQLWKLFDIVPGMDYCQLNYEGGGMERSARAVAEVVYTHPQWAAHAKEKLHGFEYPPGSRLIVRPVAEGIGDCRGDRQAPPPRDVNNIAHAIAQASSLIRAAGLDPSVLNNLANAPKQGDSIDSCSVNLPSPKPLASIDAEMVERCFVICSPTALSNAQLRDLFSRFGNLIDAYFLANRNCGYAKFADRKSAEDAIDLLHGAEVNGIRIKVIKAEEQRKRPRTDDTW